MFFKESFVVLDWVHLVCRPWHSGLPVVHPIYEAPQWAAFFLTEITKFQFAFFLAFSFLYWTPRSCPVLTCLSHSAVCLHSAVYSGVWVPFDFFEHIFNHSLCSLSKVSFTSVSPEPLLWAWPCSFEDRGCPVWWVCDLCFCVGACACAYGLLVSCFVSFLSLELSAMLGGV